MKATILAVLMAVTLIGCGGYKAGQHIQDCRKAVPDKASVGGDLSVDCSNDTVIQPTTVYKEVPVEVPVEVVVEKVVEVEVPVEKIVYVDRQTNERVPYANGMEYLDIHPTTERAFLDECLKHSDKGYDRCNLRVSERTWWQHCTWGEFGYEAPYRMNKYAASANMDIVVQWMDGQNYGIDKISRGYGEGRDPLCMAYLRLVRKQGESWGYWH